MMRSLLTLSLLVQPLAAMKTSSSDALGLGLDAEAEARPVMKVVKLLQDMKADLETERTNDKEVHENMDCWCNTNEKEKTKAIEDGGIAIQQLTAAIGEAKGKIGEMTVKRKDTAEELAENEKALGDAKALRAKELAAFNKDDKDTVVAVAATKDAITVLSKHNAELIEVHAVAKQLAAANILKMGTLDNLKQAALKDFIRDAQGATSFLAIPGFKSYGSQSGQIFGILSQMKDDFDDHLAEIRNAEKKAVADFGALESAKNDQISDGKKDIVDLDKRLGETTKKAADDTKNLADTKTQKGNDETFFTNLKTKCSEHDTEYDTRTKDRLTEMTAVDTAIGTLNDEDNFKLFGKTVDSFLQISSSESEGEQMRRKSAASVLERAAGEADAPMLALLAGRVRLDAFTEVKKAISAMVGELDKQQKDEVAHKAWCVKSTDDNTKDSAAASDKKDNLEVKRDALIKSVETLDMEIKAAQDAIVETKVQMKKGSETREAANADYQATISDQRMTQIVLSKSITTLKQVYALLENGHHARRTHAAPAEPENAKFKTYAKNSGGGVVVGLLEGILADSKLSEADAMKAETNAQSTYEGFMTDSNKAIETLSTKISTLSGNRAATKEDLIMAKKDLAATNKKIGSLASELTDIKGSCDFVIKNFAIRQDARKAEMDALNEAMAILSGSTR